jgi:hypothetical protein
MVLRFFLDNVNDHGTTDNVFGAGAPGSVQQPMIDMRRQSMIFISILEIRPVCLMLLQPANRVKQLATPRQF